MNHLASRMKSDEDIEIMDQTKGSAEGRLRILHRKKMGKMDIIQNHRETKYRKRGHSVWPEKWQCAVEWPHFFLEALLSAVSADACFVRQSTTVSILKGTPIRFWLLSLPLWSCSHHSCFLCNVIWLIPFLIRSVHYTCDIIMLKLENLQTLIVMISEPINLKAYTEFIMFSALYILIHPILSATLREIYCHHPHFTDEANTQHIAPAKLKRIWN